MDKGNCRRCDYRRSTVTACPSHQADHHNIHHQHSSSILPCMYSGKSRHLSSQALEPLMLYDSCHHHLFYAPFMFYPIFFPITLIFKRVSLCLQFPALSHNMHRQLTYLASHPLSHFVALFFHILIFAYPFSATISLYS